MREAHALGTSALPHTGLQIAALEERVEHLSIKLAAARCAAERAAAEIAELRSLNRELSKALACSLTERESALQRAESGYEIATAQSMDAMVALALLDEASARRDPSSRTQRLGASAAQPFLLISRAHSSVAVQREHRPSSSSTHEQNVPAETKMRTRPPRRYNTSGSGRGTRAGATTTTTAETAASSSHGARSTKRPSWVPTHNLQAHKLSTLSSSMLAGTPSRRQRGGAAVGAPPPRKLVAVDGGRGSSNRR